ncbi:hypothetical protein Vafri_9439 [Volvox africanus]|uniref:Elongator complex protein 5 n=1 Tax=Volvox africanus TaxID=51714 RepID=A0A8J4B8M1_9CHLO|nr:hypothetical protein Vafri_9439 [Volvox africanus]
MDAAIRHLRDGALRDASTCPTCCILDNLAVTGGVLVFRHAVQSFLSAMRQGRSQATSIRLVDLTGDLEDVVTSAPANRQSSDESQLHSSQVAADVELIDLFIDPWGWHELTSPNPDHIAGSAPEVAVGPPTPQPASSSNPAISLSTLQTSLMRPFPPSQQVQVVHGTKSVGSLKSPLASFGSGDGSGRNSGGGGGGSGGGGGGGGGGGVPGTATAATSGSRSVCVIISCFSTLMQRYGEWQALALLEAVQRSPLVSCVLTSLHTDLHPAQLVFALRRLSSCCLDLSNLTELQTDSARRALGLTAGVGAGGVLAGRLDCRTKRRTGRVKVESELYSMLPAAEAGNGSSTTSTTPNAAVNIITSNDLRVAFYPVPPLMDAPDPKTLLQLQPSVPTTAAAATATAAAAAAAPAAGAQTPSSAPAGRSGGVVAAGSGSVAGGAPPVGLLGGATNPEELARVVGSSMRLTLTEEERRAKQQVVLPYQHQGQHHRSGAVGAAYAAGDHAAYLPPAAGGTGPAAGGRGQQSLGHILYVRDSASEADSDQELDEDLDI